MIKKRIKQWAAAVGAMLMLASVCQAAGYGRHKAAGQCRQYTGTACIY